jgi:hypothetical protein
MKTNVALLSSVFFRSVFILTWELDLLRTRTYGS